MHAYAHAWMGGTHCVPVHFTKRVCNVPVAKQAEKQGCQRGLKGRKVFHRGSVHHVACVMCSVWQKDWTGIYLRFRFSFGFSLRWCWSWCSRMLFLVSKQPPATHTHKWLPSLPRSTNASSTRHDSQKRCTKSVHAAMTVLVIRLSLGCTGQARFRHKTQPMHARKHTDAETQRRRQLQMQTFSWRQRVHQNTALQYATHRSKQASADWVHARRT